MGDSLNSLLTAIKSTLIRFSSFPFRTLLEAIRCRPLLVIRVITRAVPRLLKIEWARPACTGPTLKGESACCFLLVDIHSVGHFFLPRRSYCLRFVVYMQSGVSTTCLPLLSPSRTSRLPSYETLRLHQDGFFFLSLTALAERARVTSECKCENKTRGLVLSLPVFYFLKYT